MSRIEIGLSQTAPFMSACSGQAGFARGLQDGKLWACHWAPMPMLTVSASILVKKAVISPRTINFNWYEHASHLSEYFSGEGFEPSRHVFGLGEHCCLLVIKLLIKLPAYLL